MRQPSCATWRRWAGLLGMPGWLGLALVLAAALAWWGRLPEAQAQLDEQQAQLTRLRRQLQAGPGREGPGASNRASASSSASEAHQAEAAWQDLWRTLPSAAQGADLQVEVLALARAQGVQVPSVHYKGAPLKALPGLWRQQLSLPVDAPYPAVRAWLAQLQRHPAISIDALDISRADPMGDQVKARVAVSVWWRQADLRGVRP